MVASPRYQDSRSDYSGGGFRARRLLAIPFEALAAPVPCEPGLEPVDFVAIRVSWMEAAPDLVEGGLRTYLPAAAGVSLSVYGTTLLPMRIDFLSLRGDEGQWSVGPLSLADGLTGIRTEWVSGQARGKYSAECVAP